MKLLVISDTHGQSSRAIDLLETIPNLEACIFLGDGYRDAEDLQDLYPDLSLYQVRGNCDFGSYSPEFGLAPFGGVLIYYTHGHTMGVKYGLDDLWYRADASGADVALYGHTHVAHYEKRDGIYLFNPGSLSMPRRGKPTYGIITIEDKKPAFEICEY